MVNDWESAFETCPPYGEGKGAYGPEDTALLAEMERTLERLLPWLEAEGVYLLNEYLEVYRRYARRSSRYYFYRGSLYGAREALEIWAEEHGGSGGSGRSPPGVQRGGRAGPAPGPPGSPPG